RRNVEGRMDKELNATASDAAAALQCQSRGNLELTSQLTHHCSLITFPLSTPPPMFAQQTVPADHSGVTDDVDAFVKQICEVIVGKNQAVKLAVACLLARGHVLIEDIPGVGKTTLSQALARSLALAFQRIQFTSDLLPADILGNSIFERDEQRFVFHRGPLFSQVVLIDEV